MNFKVVLTAIVATGCLGGIGAYCVSRMPNQADAAASMLAVQMLNNKPQSSSTPSATNSPLQPKTSKPAQPNRPGSKSIEPPQPNPIALPTPDVATLPQSTIEDKTPNLKSTQLKATKLKATKPTNVTTPSHQAQSQDTLIETPEVVSN